jgi:hypothetical protein
LDAHLDDASPHASKISRDCVKANNLSRPLHSPFSPGLDRSDFHVIGHIETKLGAVHGRTQEDLFENADHIFLGIPSEEFGKMYMEWMERLEQAMNTKVTLSRPEYPHNISVA